jgi:hypothetical protein
LGTIRNCCTDTGRSRTPGWDPAAGARAQAVFSKLVNAPERRLVQIGEATHIALLEKNRLQLYREVQTFLDE